MGTSADLFGSNVKLLSLQNDPPQVIVGSKRGAGSGLLLHLLLAGCMVFYKASRSVGLSA